MRRIVAITLASISILNLMVGQENGRTSWGAGLGLPGASAGYPVLVTDGWVKPWESIWLNFELGYGWDNTPTHPSHRPPETNAHRVSIAAQAMYDMVQRSYFSFFIGTGPFWHRSQGDLESGFIYDHPSRDLTAYNSATYALTRLGLQNSIGVRFFIGYVSFGARIHTPVYYTKATVSNVEDPILVVDYKPVNVRPYQYGSGRVDASFGLSFHFGCVIR